jgi:hypothetical protein
MIAIFGSSEIELSGAGPLGCLTTATVAGYKWRQRRKQGEQVSIIYDFKYSTPYSCLQHILCCIFALFVFIRCQFLWIVLFWLPLRYSLTFNNLPYWPIILPLTDIYPCCISELLSFISFLCFYFFECVQTN